MTICNSTQNKHLNGLQQNVNFARVDTEKERPEFMGSGLDRDSCKESTNMRNNNFILADLPNFYNRKGESMSKNSHRKNPSLKILQDSVFCDIFMTEIKRPEINSGLNLDPSLESEETSRIETSSNFKSILQDSPDLCNKKGESMSNKFRPAPAQFESKSQICPNTLVFNSALTDSAKIFILALNAISVCAPNWIVCQSDLQKRLGWGRDKMVSVMKICEKHGYIRKTQKRMSGKFGQNEFEFDIDGKFKNNQNTSEYKGNNFSEKRNESSEEKHAHNEYQPLTCLPSTVQPSSVLPTLPYIKNIPSIKKEQQQEEKENSAAALFKFFEDKMSTSELQQAKKSVKKYEDWPDRVKKVIEVMSRPGFRPDETWLKSFFARCKHNWEPNPISENLKSDLTKKKLQLFEGIPFTRSEKGKGNILTTDSGCEFDLSEEFKTIERKLKWHLGELR